MREEAVNAPEPEQNNAFGRSEPQAPDQASTSGRRRQRRDAETTLSRHATKCRICNNPDRHAIEFEFLNWRNPADLARSYKLRDLTTIYRHAHATGLFAKRRLNLRFAMERIVERVNEVPVTATSVIRAARAISRINDSGEWVDPPSRVIVTHINRVEDCEAPSVADAEASPAPRRRGTTKITAGSARSSLRAHRRGLPGRRLVEPGGSVPSGLIPDIPARDSSETISRPSLIFDDLLLDEPSESASGELPRIDGKPAPPEVILQLTPEFARCREERHRAIEADRQARAASASGSGGFTPPASSQTENVPLFSSSLPQATRQGTASAVPTPTPQEQQSVVSSPSLLPQAAFPTSASSALPHPAAIENNVADVKQSVAMPSSSLPSAAPDTPATAKQSPRAAGPPLGSSGSANPPFPFTPEPLRRWKPRRHF